MNSQDAEPRERPGTDTAEATNDELRALVIELEGRWHRTVADFDNFRKRTARDLARLRAVERTRQAAAWLPVLDNLDAALAHAETDPGAIVDGVLAVRDQAVELLAGLGFPRRDDEVGTPFDPELHEAVGAVPSVDVEPGTIVEVLRPGYGDGEHLLRPASVVVARAD